ncbi:MAG: glycosyltransferase, partial [Flavobacteriaceae bacterium]|nr:glycosyltransferase [Flavobacteriaceae bacterium]
MKLLIISHTLHKKQGNSYFAYGPYIREMNLWEKNVDELLVVAPMSDEAPGSIDLPYTGTNIKFYRVPAFSLRSFGLILKTLFQVPGILWVLFKAMRKADHIHLRCPGNMGLLGCFVQVFFPKKPKSAKYAGNWDPNARQPRSYRLQKWFLNNPFLTRNMQVMVYGNWPQSSKNIVPFFTATYPESKRQKIIKDFQPPYKVLFVGGLTKGKNPLYAVQLTHKLLQTGLGCTLDLYGEGAERPAIEAYIQTHELQGAINLYGNQSGEIVEQGYKTAHFLILPSQSEGWPKSLAEGMFWGCIPLATPVSCVPEMLGQGERGVLLTKQLERDVKVFSEV